ncbi:amino acid adenylation domain-containing protein [Nannocystaceae bacterium ST9]
MHASSGARTLAELLWQRAEARPDALVQSFTTHAGERELRSVGQLAERAAAIAHALAELAEPGERVVLALAPGLAIVDALFACFAAGLVAVPIPPPRPGASEGIERLAALVRDAEPRIVIGERELIERARVDIRVDIPGPRWLDVEALAELADDHRGERALALARPDRLALLQYTSGSTGDPRGVCLSHANVLANLAAIADAFALDSSRVGVSWLPHFHDMGLIGTILAPVHAGFAMHRMAPESFLARPLRWLEAITEHRASVSGGPDFGFALCCQAIADAPRIAGSPSLDLSSWRVAFVGAEPVRAATLAAFAARFAALGFDPRAWLPCYGLAESTLFVTGVRVDARPSIVRLDARALAEGKVLALADDARTGHALVGCGEPRAEPAMAIVDPEGRELAADEIGEIAVRGASVSAGYHRRPPRPDEWLRTGDLGFVHAGQLYVTGRRKDLIIVRGRNLYPQDLEARAARHGPPIRAGRAAAFGIDDERGERAVLVQEVRGECPREGWAALAEALRVAIGEAFEFELDTLALVAAGEVPLTSSGKVRRSTCRDRFVEDRLQVLALARARPRAPLELPELAALAELADDERRAAIAGALTDWLVARAGRAPLPGRSLAQLGLDSLVLVELASELEGRCGVSLGLGSLLTGDLDRLAAMIADAIATRDASSERASTPEPDDASVAAVTSGEAGLWSASRRSPDDSADLIARAAWVEGELDERALGLALDDLLLAWPTLRSEFVVERGEVVRRVGQARPGTLQIERWPDADRERLLASLRERAFEAMALDRGPLLRAWLLHGRDATLLGIAVHHVLVDEASLQQFGRALGQRLQAASAGHDPRGASPARAIEVARFARERAAMLASPSGQALRERWRARLAGLGHARLPELGPRPALREHRRLAPGSAALLEALARRLATSRFATSLALSAALLVRAGLADHERVCLATPADLRTSGGFRDALGYLVDLLPIVVEPDLRLGFDRLAAQVELALARAIDDQALPYAQMQLLEPGFEPALVLSFHAAEHSSPGFAAWSAGLAEVAIELPGLRLRSAPLPPRHAQFALHLAVVAIEGRLELVATADARRHDRASLAGLLEGFECALEALARRPELELDELPITREPPLALTGPSEGDSPWVLASIAEVAARTPDATALVADTRSLDYAGLLRATRSLAARLRELGVGPEQRVGLCMPRGPELVVAMLAVFAVGAAYVPLELRLPDRRLQQLAALSGCTRVLCGPQQAGLFTEDVALTIEPALLRSTRAMRSSPPVHEANLACVLFTSGSTGEPKGVAITRRGVANLLAWARAYQGESLRGRVFAGTGIGFDLSLFELLAPLSLGGTVVIGADALDLPSGAGIGLLDTVPSIAAALLERGLPSDLRTINLAGEPLSWALVDALRARAPQAEIHDLYGPTETTTYSTGARVSAGPTERRGEAPAIGGPIRATRCVLMDARQRALPRGLIGELHIGGAGLARGYLDRPAETAARFVPDPSGPIGERVYRTGDRVRLDDEGQLHYFGRGDRQLKLAGVRIEPGEIEAVLASHPDVAQAAVQLDPLAGRLIAHVALAGPGPHASGEQLRRFASERLPAAMVPAAIETLAALPRTARGKLDRAALPSPSALRSRPEFRAPRSELELELAELWARQLGVERVGVDDDFFALGGHSLAAMLVLATIQDRHAVALAVRELYERPTIAALAEAIAAARWASEGPASEHDDHDDARERGSL